MSQMISLLDEQGNIDSHQVAKEIKASLEFDIRYKQIDNMKKRAIRSATSYDEFQNMVACAHLKKLSKKEVESLSQVKQGWVKASSVKSKESKASILDFEKDQENLKNSNLKPINLPEKLKKKKNKKIKSVMELERDLRRIPVDEKWSFLNEVGLTQTLSVIKEATEIDFMEEILRILSRQAEKVSSTETVDAIVKPSEDETEQNEGEKEQESENIPKVVCSWLEGIASLQKFPLFKQFANKELLSSAHTFLSNHAHYVQPETLVAYS